jgi:hypothetical protein
MAGSAGAGSSVAAGSAGAAGSTGAGSAGAPPPHADNTIAVNMSTATRLYQNFLDMVFFSFLIIDNMYKRCVDNPSDRITSFQHE